MAFLTRRFLTAVKLNQAVKSTFKTHINIKIIYRSRIRTNPIWFTNKPTMAFLTRQFLTAVKFNQTVKYTFKTPISIETISTISTE